MLLNLILGMIIPWALGIWLYHRDKSIILTIAPLEGCVAFFVNSIGFHYGFWNLYPYSLNRIADLPYDLGFYPISAAMMIYLIRHKKLKPLPAIFIFTLLTSIAEYMGVIIGRITYGNGWNEFFTFCSYLAPYILGYGFYRVLVKESILHEQ